MSEQKKMTRRGTMDMEKDKAVEAAEMNIISPKGIATKKEPSGEDATPKDIKKTRKRLSVVSDNTLVDGVAGVEIEETAAPTEAFEGKTSCVKTYAGVSKKGYAPYNPRKKNQDSILMSEDPATGSLLFCVFDGHGEQGDNVSGYFKERLAMKLYGHPLWAPNADTEKECENIKQALRDTVLNIEKAILKESSIDSEFSGTTGVMSVIRGDRLIVANVGDSRIILGTVLNGSSGATPVTVSLDHKPDVPEEKARIIAAGGRVFAVEYDDGVDGPPRVWLGHMDVPGLAMSRSLCDSIAHTAGVSSEPEFFVKKIGPQDKYIVIVSDGLWEFMSNEEVLKICDKHKEAKAAVDALITEANSRWMKEEQVIDDTTVIVAHLSVAAK